MASYMPSTFYFPLRTNAGYFDSPEGYLSLTSRIKQASLLYDKLLFESGLYTCTVWDEGAIDAVVPPGDACDKQIQKNKANFEPTGKEARLFMQTDKGHTIEFSGRTVRMFHSEFHSVLRELDAEHLPWIEMESYELTERGARKSNFIEESLSNDFGKALGEQNCFLESRMLSNLSHDLALGSALQVAASLDALYAPLLSQIIQIQPAPGFAALQVSVPNLASLEWEEIVELRDHDCLLEFRQKMASLEKMALEALPQGESSEIHYQFMLQQSLIRELCQVLKEHQPTVGTVAGDVALDLLLGLIPIPGVSSAVTGIRGATELREMNQSWLAAFLRLTKA